MARKKGNRFQRRQAKRIRVYFASLGSNQIAELDPATGRVDITTFQGYCKGMERTFMATSPTFATSERVRPGSAQEARSADYRARHAQPFYEEPNQGTRFYR